jgi:NDP-sugar pyrophosphorylase family protein
MAVDNVESSAELLVININELLKIEFNDPISFFKERNFNAAVITFNSVHPRYSYAKINDQGLVIEVSEKNPISPNAIAGFFWFKTSDIFFNAIKSMILKDCRVENLFYLSPILNELILTGLKVGSYTITPSYFIPIKNQMQIDALFSSKKNIL